MIIVITVSRTTRKAEERDPGNEVEDHFLGLFNIFFCFITSKSIPTVCLTLEKKNVLLCVCL